MNEPGPEIIRAPYKVDDAGVHYGSHVRKAIVLYDDGEWVHLCAGNRMVSDNPDTFLLWTLCGKDVPAGRGYINQFESVTCEKCRLGER